MERPSARLAPSPCPIITLVIAFVIALGIAPVLFAQNKRPEFTPPELLTAADVTYPITSGAAGVVVVAVSLDAAGMIKGTDVLRDIPSLTAPVLLSIQNWTFKAAMLDGKGIDSTIVVSIAFNPADYRLGGASAPVLGKELKILSADANGFLPPKTIAASWAVYPVNSVAQGGVILGAHVNRAGRVTHVAPVWETPSLTRTSVDAAKSWTFEPATFKDRPIGANAVVGYVFRPPNIAAPVSRP
jgi:Gram-negative bacterial TonB protein C-terminal